MPASTAARRALAIGLLAAAAGAAPATAAAQTDEPIGLFAFDVRGSFVPFTRNAELAGRYGFKAPETPGPGLGLDAGAHLYPLRWRWMTFGIGAGFHSSFANQARAEMGPDADEPGVRKRFTSVSSQLSLNFGGRDGWSYVSFGVGRSRLVVHSSDRDPPAVQAVPTTNYGGGARWFETDRMAFSLDLRFHALRAPRMTVVVISIGASFK